MCSLLRSKAGLALADPITSQDSNDSDDIARYINSRQAQRPGDSARPGVSGSRSSQQGAASNYPTGRILVESTQDSNTFRPIGRVLVESTQDSNIFNGDDEDLLRGLADNGVAEHEFFNSEWK